MSKQTRKDLNRMGLVRLWSALTVLIWGKCAHYEEKIHSLLFFRMVIGLEENAENTKYIFQYREGNAI